MDRRDVGILGQQHAQAFARQRFVINNQRREWHGFHHVRPVPGSHAIGNTMTAAAARSPFSTVSRAASP